MIVNRGIHMTLRFLFLTVLAVGALHSAHGQDLRTVFPTCPLSLQAGVLHAPEFLPVPAPELVLGGSLESERVPIYVPAFNLSSELVTQTISYGGPSSDACFSIACFDETVTRQTVMVSVETWPVFNTELTPDPVGGVVISVQRGNSGGWSLPPPNYWIGPLIPNGSDLGLLSAPPGSPVVPEPGGLALFSLTACLVLARKLARPKA